MQGEDILSLCKNSADCDSVFAAGTAVFPVCHLLSAQLPAAYAVRLPRCARSTHDQQPVKPQGEGHQEIHGTVVRSCGDCGCL